MRNNFYNVAKTQLLEINVSFFVGYFENFILNLILECNSMLYKLQFKNNLWEISNI